MIGKFLSQEVPVYQAGLAFLCLYLSIEYFKGSLDKKSGREVKNSNNNDNNSDLNNNNVTVQKKGEKGNSSNAEEENKTATKSVTQSEVDQEAEEYMDEEDSLLAVKNSYGMLDGPFKLMLCVNMSLNMGKGKIAAQCGHATLGAYIISKARSPSALRTWSAFGQAKIALKVEDENAMYAIKEAAQKAGLVTYIVADAGRTQIAAGSETVLAIGPAPESILKTITGHLKLL